MFIEKIFVSLAFNILKDIIELQMVKSARILERLKQEISCFSLLKSGSKIVGGSLLTALGVFMPHCSCFLLFLKSKMGVSSNLVVESA